MATYAVLGSTGNCGTALIQNLLQRPSSPEVKINAYCRSKAKLHRLLPEVAEDKRVRVFEGRVDDTELMVSCVRGARAVFLVASTNDNIPGCSVSRDCTVAVVRALGRIKAEAEAEAGSDGGKGWRPPRLVLLSSSTIDLHLSRHMPWWFRPILNASASHVYADVAAAELVLRSHDFWLPSVYVKPAGLSVDVARGHRLDLDEDENFVSYLDLAAGMIEAADDEGGRWDGRNVAVVNGTKGVGAKFPPGTPRCIFWGLVRHHFPFLHPYLPSGTGPV